jgi:hypothetical protein
VTTLTIPATAGSQNWYLHVKDKAGNTRNSAVDTVIYDVTAPDVPTFTITPAYTKTTSVAITMSASDNAGGSGLAGYAFTNSTATPSSWTEPYAEVATMTISATAGSQNWYLHVKDNVGYMACSAVDTVFYDATAPDVPTFTITPAYTKTTSVAISMSASDDTDGSGLAGYAFTNSAATPSSWTEPYAEVATLTIPATAGSQNWYLHVKDKAGNTRNSAMDTVFYDATAPDVPTFTITPAYTKTTSVAISMSASDDTDGSGLAGYAFTNSADEPGSWTEPYAEVMTMTLPTSSEGSQDVYLHVKDYAGNTKYNSDTVYLDKSVPSITSATYNNTSHILTLEMSGVDASGYKSVIFGTTSGDLSSTALASGTTTITANIGITLEAEDTEDSDDEIQTFYYKVVDNVGNSSSVEQSCTLGGSGFVASIKGFLGIDNGTKVIGITPGKTPASSSASSRSNGYLSRRSAEEFMADYRTAVSYAPAERGNLGGAASLKAPSSAPSPNRGAAAPAGLTAQRAELPAEGSDDAEGIDADRESDADDPLLRVQTEIDRSWEIREEPRVEAPLPVPEYGNEAAETAGPVFRTVAAVPQDPADSVKAPAERKPARASDEPSAAAVMPDGSLRQRRHRRPIGKVRIV